jgi:hypothetical protein
MDTNALHKASSDRVSRLLCVLILLGIALFVFGPAGDDDGHITYTAAKNFADSGIITNNNGDLIEQSSSLLQVLLLGVEYKIATYISSAANIVTLGPFFSLFFALLCLPFTYSLAQRLHIKNPIHTSILLSVSTGFSYWAMGGLESTLTSACVLYFLFAVSVFIKHHQPPYFNHHLFLSLGAFLLVRPESIFVLVAFLCFFSVLLIMQKNTALLARVKVIAVYAAFLFIVISICRYGFSGQIFPQPVYAKAEGFSPIKIAIGLYYFIYSAQLTLIIYSLCLILVLKNRKGVSPHTLAALSFCFAYLAFIVASGGDWMAGGRFFVPIIPVLIVLTCFSLQHNKHYSKFIFALVGLSILEVAAFSYKLSAGVPPSQLAEFQQRYNSIHWNAYSYTETNNLVHARDIPVIDALNKIIRSLPAQGKPIVIGSIQMGMVPFHLRKNFNDKVYVVDFRGITTQHLNQCPTLANAPRTWSGIAIRYQDYFNAISECQLPRPDIVYDLLNREPEVNAERLATVQREGYTIVYRQQGKLMPAHGLKSVDVDTFIAVSPAIYSALPLALHDQQIIFKRPQPKIAKKE